MVFQENALKDLAASLMAGDDPAKAIAACYGKVDAVPARPLDLKKATRHVPVADQGLAKRALRQQPSKAPTKAKQLGREK